MRWIFPVKAADWDNNETYFSREAAKNAEKFEFL
jgi:hypothetical protein